MYGFSQIISTVQYIWFVRYVKKGTAPLCNRHLCLIILVFICLIILAFGERVVVYYFDSLVYSPGVLLNSEVYISFLFMMIK